jgi:plastocyanin
MRVRAAVIVVAVAGLVAAVAPARAASTNYRVLMSNFRYCPERPFPCDPLDVGYPGGADNKPAADQYSPITTVSVKRGDTVTWIYDEPLCGAGAFCPPHNVVWANGSLANSDDIKSQGVTFTVTIPDDAARGATYAYYCRYHAPFGMNGALRLA